jgi:hypothetical protein
MSQPNIPMDTTWSLGGRRLAFSPTCTLQLSSCQILLSLLCRDLVTELVQGIYLGHYTWWDTWHNALSMYKICFEWDLLCVTPLVGGYWDTPLPSSLFESDTDEETNIDN